MTSSGPDTSRPYDARGRLADFESADSDDLKGAAALLAGSPVLKRVARRRDRTAGATPSEPGTTPQGADAAPPPQDAVTSTAPEPAAVPSPTQQLTAPLPTPKRRPGRPRKDTGRPRKDTAADAVRGTTIYIAAHLFDRIESVRTTKRMSNGEIVLAAVDATHRQLPALIAAERTAAAGGENDAAAGDSLFAPRPSAGRPRKAVARTMLQVRFREADYAVLDRLVAQVGANSRSHLINLALDAYLADF